MKRLPKGTFINMATILLGGVIGLMLQQVLPENIQVITLQAVGLAILVIAIQMSIKLPEELWIPFIFSLVIGSVLGEVLDVKGFLDGWELAIKDGFKIGEKRFSDGFIAAFIFFCASPITIVGAVEEGINNKRELLLVKSVLDGITAIALASTYGFGVLFSIIPLLFIQGGFTLLGIQIKGAWLKSVLAQISAIGAVILIALALKILAQIDIKVANLLPALVTAVLITSAYSRLKLRF